jgi:hypothetical protein
VTTASSTAHTYAAAGTYTFAVYVDDLHGHNVSSSATASIAFVLNLVPGWNFVSIPVVGGAYKASTLGLLPGDSVSGYNTMTGKYDKNYYVGVSPPLFDFAIAESTGYWIYVNVTETLSLNGSVPTTPLTRTITVPAGGGWVTVGFESLNTTRHASDIPPMYSGGSITTVVTYIQATGKYSSWFASAPMLNNFLLVPGQSYWVWCSASGTLTYNP